MKVTSFVSLGRACDTAHQIRRHFGQRESYPFDWISMPLDSLVFFLTHRFEDFLQRDNLFATNGVVEDGRHKVRFLHDFPDGRIDDETFADAQARYSKRIANLNALVESDQVVLFVRGSQFAAASHTVDASGAERLADALGQLRPRRSWRLLIQNPPDANIPEWTTDRIAMRHLRPPDTWRWQGDDARWSELLEAVVAETASMGMG